MEERGDYFEVSGTRIEKKRILELSAQAAEYVFQVFLDLGKSNKTDHLNSFQFRSSLASLVPVWLLLYGVILCVGIVLNCKLIYWIHGMTRSKVCVAHLFLLRLFLGNSLNDLLIKDVIVLPVSFSTLTGVHWVLGGNFCKFFPIIQDSCFYSSSLILLCAFVLRFRQISHSSFHSGTQVIEYQKSIKHYSSAAVLLVCFGIALCAIIPHTVYIEFTNLAYYFGPAFQGSGVCYVRRNNIMDYVKYLFIIFYVVPVCLSLSYHFKTSDIIDKWEQSSETFAKTKRLTIHRGSLIETSSFMNCSAQAKNSTSASEPVSAPSPIQRQSFAADSKHRLLDSPTAHATRDLGPMRENSIKRNRRNMERIDVYRDEDVNRGSGARSSSCVLEKDVVGRQTRQPSVRCVRHGDQDLVPASMRETGPATLNQQSVSRRAIGAETSLEFEDNRRRRNTINFYASTTTVATRSAATSLAAPDAGGLSRRSSDRSQEQSSEEMERRTRKQTLPDVRVDDVLNSMAASQDTTDAEEEEDVESSRKTVLRTSLDLENVIQRTMSRILLLHSLFLLPFNILRFVKHLMPAWDNELSLDIAFLTFVALTFCTILVVPIVVVRSCVPDYEDGLQRFLRDEDRRAMGIQ